MPKKRTSWLAVAVLLIIAGVAYSDEAFRLGDLVFSSGGSPASGENFSVDGTLGQPAALRECSSPTMKANIGFWSDYVPGVTAVGPDTPGSFIDRLYQNHPNPFNPRTTIRFTVAKDSRVVLTVYNVTGQRVRTLVNEDKPAGSYRAVWNGRSNKGNPVASGIYFYRLRIGSKTLVKKMLLLK